MTYVRGRTCYNMTTCVIANVRAFVCFQGLDSEQDQEEATSDAKQDIEALFDELQSLTESEPEVDNISIVSTPKPKLRYTLRHS